MQRTVLWLCAAGLVACAPVRVARAQTAEQDSDIAGIVTQVVALRQYNGALHLGVLFRNTTNRPVRASQALPFDKISIVDAASRRKSFVLRDVAEHFLAGPTSDWNDGGRWFPAIAAGSQVLVWALFEPVTATALDVYVPLSQPFEGVPVTTDLPKAGEDVGTAQGPVRAVLTSASRANGELRVRLKLTNPGRTTAEGGAVRYADAYVLDAVGRRKFPVMKDTDGNYLAQPISDSNEGGRFFLSRVQPGGQLFMTLTFAAPPDAVKTVDVVIPWMDPFENVTISGAGGTGGGGSGVAGRTTDLDRAIQDLHADVTPQQIRMSLSADVLFDFDKADLKPAAAAQLQKVATVLTAYPAAPVNIDGYTDAKGSDAYNLTLSTARARSVAAWLTANAGIAGSRLHTRGLGKVDPIAPNTKPDGSDDPDGRAKNRRVAITIVREQE